MLLGGNIYFAECLCRCVFASSGEFLRVECCVMVCVRPRGVLHSVFYLFFFFFFCAKTSSVF